MKQAVAIVACLTLICGAAFALTVGNQPAASENESASQQAAPVLTQASQNVIAEIGEGRWSAGAPSGCCGACSSEKPVCADGENCASSEKASCCGDAEGMKGAACGSCPGSSCSEEKNTATPECTTGKCPHSAAE